MIEAGEGGHFRNGEGGELTFKHGSFSHF
jgi:hypothetical protein